LLGSAAISLKFPCAVCTFHALAFRHGLYPRCLTVVVRNFYTLARNAPICGTTFMQKLDQTGELHAGAKTVGEGRRWMVAGEQQHDIFRLTNAFNGSCKIQLFT
jgi:hypothetical protein